MIQLFVGIKCVSWEDWWTYDGISGPSFWGLINPEWSLCNEGRKQSPININPGKLLYDPSLEKILLGQEKVMTMVLSLIFRIAQKCYFFSLMEM